MYVSRSPIVGRHLTHAFCPISFVPLTQTQSGICVHSHGLGVCACLFHQSSQMFVLHSIYWSGFRRRAGGLDVRTSVARFYGDAQFQSQANVRPFDWTSSHVQAGLSLRAFVFTWDSLLSIEDSSEQCRT